MRGYLGDAVAIDGKVSGVEWEAELDGFRADHQVMRDDGLYVSTSDTLAIRVWKIGPATGDRVGSAYVSDFPHGNHLHQLPDT